MRATELLFEKQNYEEMFNKLLGKEAGMDIEIKNEIKWAKQTLKRKDRITWYLRLVRYKVARKMYNNDEISDDVLRKYQREVEKNYNVSSTNDLRWSGPGSQNIIGSGRMKDAFEHYMSLNSPEVQNIEFTNQNPEELYQELEAAEEKWIERVGGKALKPREDDYKLIEFDGGWAWWVLPRPYCEDEADSMGHCGNEPSYEGGDEILSLRQHIGDGYQVPHLTFILKEGGYLGEMKGRGNEKPKPKYHKYIVELLLHDYVNGIQGGGYEPGNNFSLNDLDDETRKKLFAKKPKLKPIDELWFEAHHGGEKEKQLYYQKLKSLIDFQDIQVKRITDEGVILDEWKHPFDFLRQEGSTEIEYLVDKITMDELDFDLPYMQQSEIDNLYDMLPRKHKEKIIEFLDNQGENVREEAPSDLLTDYDDLVSMFRSALVTGLRQGTEKALAKKLINVAESAELAQLEVGGIEHRSDGSIYYLIPHRQMAHLLADVPDEELTILSDGDERFIFDSPPDIDRLEEFDEDAALEHLQDEIEQMFS